MHRHERLVFSLGLALLGGCAAGGLPLPPTQSGPEPGAATPATGIHEHSLVVRGSPTEVYALVARGILGCWFGARGPLKQSHVFHANAESAFSGGEADILLHERDLTLRDQRGPRAYRINISKEANSTRIVATAHKMDSPKAEAMAKDVETWAKGNSGCQLGTRFPPPPPPAQAAAKGAGTKKGKAKPKR